MSDTRRLLSELVAARNARSPERVARLLGDDVRYWDCERGDVAGRERVAATLVELDAVEPESVAVSGDDAVLELQCGTRSRYRSTEVYRVADAAVVSIKAYFDPHARA